MPDPLETQALSAATREVLETMFFMDVLSETAEPPQGSPGTIEAHLRFAGERPGEFRISVTAEAARSIATNFLGLDDESAIQDSQVGEVAAELANMICGSVLSRVSCDRAFDLSHPEVGPPADDARIWPDAASRTFDLGNGWLTTILRFEQA
jgi:CheY-specific phosphatase CheX